MTSLMYLKEKHSNYLERSKNVVRINMADWFENVKN